MTYAFHGDESTLDPYDLICEYSVEISHGSMYEAVEDVLSEIEQIHLRAANRVEKVIGNFRQEVEPLLISSADLEKMESAGSASQKGASLEELTNKLMLSLGLRLIKQNMRLGYQEIDLVYENRSNIPRLNNQRSEVIVECKNCKAPVGSGEVGKFVRKMGHRAGQCSLGVFVAWNGVTSEFLKDLEYAAVQGQCIVLLEGEGIKNSVRMGKFIEYFNLQYEKTVYMGRAFSYE